jgi:hypothetical protein
MRTTSFLALAALLHADVSSGGEPFRKLSIAVVASGGSPESCVARMKRIFPDAAVTQIAPESGWADLRHYALVALPSEWTMHWKQISARRADYTRYVRGGGGLLLFQPNPHRFRDEQLQVDLLPAPFTVHNQYHDNGVERVGEPALLKGLGERDLPYPCDRILEWDPPWTLLARGTQSQNGSLIVARFGRGRAAVDSDHHGRDSNSSGFHSDEFLRRLVGWLTRR